MFGGPPVPDTDKPTQDRDPVGDYKLTHDVSEIAESLMETPDRVVPLDLPCPACNGRLVGKANRYTRSVLVRCTRCTFRVTR